LQIGSAIAVVLSPTICATSDVDATDIDAENVGKTAVEGVYETPLCAWFLGRKCIEAEDCLRVGVLG